MIKTPQESQTTEDISDAEVDELMNRFGLGDDQQDGPSQPSQSEPEPTVEAPAVAAKPAAPAPQVAQPPKEPEHEYQAKGKLIKEPLSMILKRASQGYSYAQDMAALNQRAESLNKIESTYKPIDEWVRANPEKWERLQAVVKAEQAGHGDFPVDHPVISEMRTQLSEIISERQAAQHKREDEALDAEIKSIQEKYKDLDWVTADESGRTREQLVLDHARQHGFRTFKTAFLDLYHDDLLKSAETRAREQFAAQKEKQSKVGLLNGKATSPTAPSEIKFSQPKKNTKSYPSTEEILQELGVG